MAKRETVVSLSPHAEKYDAQTNRFFSPCHALDVE